MRAAPIKDALVDQLAATHPDRRANRIWPEMSICLGQSRIDVCLINEQLSGFEIKSDADNTSRLAGQVLAYGRVLDQATLVVEPTRLASAHALVPDWWGLTVAETSGGGVALTVDRAAAANPEQDPYSIAQLLWRDEAYGVLEEFGHHDGLRRSTRWAIWDRLVESLCLDALKSVVRERLKVRPAWQGR